MTVAQSTTWQPGHDNASGMSHSRKLVPRRTYAAITAVLVPQRRATGVSTVMIVGNPKAKGSNATIIACING